MGIDDYCIVKKYNLLENLSPTPKPPPFQDFISLINTTKQIHTRYSLPHQIPSSNFDHINNQYMKIRARPLNNFDSTNNCIWTQTNENNFLFDINIIKKFFIKPATSFVYHKQYSRITSISNSITRPFQILNSSFQMTYDITMQHLIQLLTKTHTTIDDILQGIDRGDINIECLQCVQRLYKILNKQFINYPNDKIKLENYSMSNLNQLNLVEHFFLKLFHLSYFDLKLKSYQYRDEFQIQINIISQSITRLINGIHLILNDCYLPKIFQFLCFLYNNLSNKSVPGLDFNSLIDALNSPTNQTKKTVAHVLVEILYQYHRDILFNIINNEKFIELKTFVSMKYEKFYIEIRQIYKEYQQLEYEYSMINNIEQLPIFISVMLNEAKIQFEKLFQQENELKKGEENLMIYFCAHDLSIDLCLTTIGQFVDKLHRAYLDNIQEENRLFSLINYQQRKRSNSLQINSFLPCHCL